MTTSLDDTLRQIRPTVDDVRSELSPQQQVLILRTVRRPAAPSAVARPLWRRRTILTVAAGLAVVTTSGVSLIGPRLAGVGLGELTAVPAQAASLDALAVRARQQPPVLPVPEGKYRRVVTVEKFNGRGAITHEAYVAPDGWTWRKDTEAGLVPGSYDRWFLYPANTSIDPRHLPTDSGVLEHVLREQWLGTASDDQGLFKLIGEVLRTEITPPGVRAAAIGLITAMAVRPAQELPGRKGGTTTPSVEVFDGMLDSRDVIGAKFTDLSRPETTTTYWFDSATSELVRTDQTWPGQTYSSEIRSREVVKYLPDDIMEALGTARIEKVR